MAQKQESYFWTSYSDLMTSLFFVMLVLFVLACAMLKNKIDEVEKQKEATEKELAKIKEIEESIEAIDPNFFEYNSTHKKHILKINVQFQKNSSDITDIPFSNFLISPSLSFSIWSSLSAAKRAARVVSSICTFPARHCLNREPTAPSVGSFVSWHIKLFASMCFFRRFIWVVLPLPSIPSKTMKCPFEMLIWVLRGINNP